jgi:hypothetical protein
MEEEATGRRVEEEEALEDHVGRGHWLQRRAGQDPGQVAAEGGSEPSTGGAVVGVGQEEASEHQRAAERLDLGRGERRVLPVASQVEEGVVEEPGAGEGHRPRLGHHLHRGPALKLPGQPTHARHPTVPAPAVLRHRGNEARAVAESEGPRAQGEEGRLRSVLREKGATPRQGLARLRRTAAATRFIQRGSAV